MPHIVMVASKIWKYASHFLEVVFTGLVFAIIAGLLIQKTSDLPQLVLISVLHWILLPGTSQKIIEAMLAILFLIIFLSGIVTFIQELRQSQVPSRLYRDICEFTNDQWEELLTKLGITEEKLDGSNRSAKVRALIRKEEVEGWLDQLQDAVKEVIEDKIRADKAKIAQFLSEIVSEQNCDELIKRGEELLTLHPNHPVIRTQAAQAYSQCAQQKLKSLAFSASHASLHRMSAIQLLSHAIELDPQAGYFAWRGAAYAMEGNYQGALSDCNRAVQMGPRQAECYYCRAIVYREQRNYNLAIDDITHAIELEPSNALYYYERCLFHRQLGESQKALDDIEQAIKLYPKRERHYHVAIELEPQQSENYKRLGVFHQEEQFNHKEAIVDFTHAIELDPQVASYYFLRAKSHFNKDNYDEAIQDLTTAINLKPGCIDYYQFRGEIYRKSRDYEKAIADFTEAIKLDPQNVRNYWSRAVCYENRDGNVQVANEDYRRAAEIDSQETSALYKARGHNFMLIRDYDRAIADLTRAIELNPQDAYSYSSRAECYIRKGELRQPLKDAIHAIELAPHLASKVYYDYYWQYHNSSGHDLTIPQDQYDEIIQLFIGALRQQQGPYHFVRGLIYQKDGERRLAQQEFQQAAQIGFPGAQEQLDSLTSEESHSRQP